MSLYIQVAESGENPTDFPFLNYTGTDIPANYAVVVDTIYYVSTTNMQDGIGAALPASAGASCIGVAMETLKAGGMADAPGTGGRVRCFGPLAYCIATAAITIGAQVMNDAGTPGYVATYLGSGVALGIALTQASASADPILVMLVSTGGGGGIGSADGPPVSGVITPTPTSHSYLVDLTSVDSTFALPTTGLYDGLTYEFDLTCDNNAPVHSLTVSSVGNIIDSAVTGPGLSNQIMVNQAGTSLVVKYCSSSSPAKARWVEL